MITQSPLVVPTGVRGTALRREFTEVVCDDWIKILTFASTEDIIDTSVNGMLAAAIEEAKANPELLGSEFFHCYFRALECLRQQDWPSASAAVMTLGNVLLPLLAAGHIRIPLPVSCDSDGLAVLPSGLASAGVHMDGQVVDPAGADQLLEQITQAVESSWYAKIDGWGVRGHTGPIDSEVTKYEARISRITGEPAGLSVLDRAGAGPIVAGLTAAAELLRDVAPQVAEEISAVTEYVVPLGGDHFVGGSDIYLYGASFLRLDPAWTPLCFADHLVHEEAHEFMHAEHELRPLLLNRDFVGAPSPIRTDPRPLYGTFHATFVFARLASFMDLFLTQQPENSEAKLRLHRHLLGLLQGLYILAEHGIFSERGEREIEAWRELADKLVQAHGMPRPDLYLQLTWDYDRAHSDLPVYRP